ncbi:hypothetical protein GCM10023176_58810 [Micromonospora coerulea]|uniref:Uncharacterized protein n=1 Tax=Micromonospora coerulea TaxID=47856 RepID=A0ABP8T6L9_9ACTN
MIAGMVVRLLYLGMIRLFSGLGLLISSDTLHLSAYRVNVPREVRPNMSSGPRSNPAGAET